MRSRNSFISMIKIFAKMQPTKALLSYLWAFCAVLLYEMDFQFGETELS